MQSVFARCILGTALILAIPFAPRSVHAETPAYEVISKEQFSQARAQARREAKDKFAMAESNSAQLGFSKEEVQRANQPAMHLHGSIETVLENGVRLRMRWDRFGYAENPLANLKKVDATLFQTNKGGSRADWTVFPDEVKALALEMDDKLALWGDAIEGRFIRGAKLGVGIPEVIGMTSWASSKTSARFKKGMIIDPSTFSIKDMNRVAKAVIKSYVRAGGRPGPGFDVLAGDMNIKFPQLAEMARTFSKILRRQAKALKRRLTIGVSGLAHKDGDPSGGIEFRKVSTGYGVWVAAKLEAKRSGLPLSGATVATEGYGEVGRGFVKAALNDGSKIIALAEVARKGGHRAPGVFLHPAARRQGREPLARVKARVAKLSAAESRAWVQAIEAFQATGQDLDGYVGRVNTGEGQRTMLLRDCFVANARISQIDLVDIVGVNARGGSINPKTIPEFARRPTFSGKKKIVTEGANLAASLEGASMISKRYSDALKVVHTRPVITFLHGIFANGGGVFTSDLQIVQNLFDEMVASPIAQEALETVMGRIYKEVVKLQAEEKVSTRKAIALLANKRRMLRALNRPGAPANNLDELVISLEQRKKRPDAVKTYAEAVLKEYGLGKRLRKGKGPQRRAWTLAKRPASRLTQRAKLQVRGAGRGR
ncbi:MAG: hypothetical protein JRH20_03870 [Deltaproteobacteria bacterium]|nr:hypothetical protein [Deltaproteobacteria bacterium]